MNKKQAYNKVKNKYKLNCLEMEEIAKAYIQKYEYLACDFLSDKCIKLNNTIREIRK